MGIRQERWNVEEFERELAEARQAVGAIDREIEKLQREREVIRETFFRKYGHSSQSVEYR